MIYLAWFFKAVEYSHHTKNQTDNTKSTKPHEQRENDFEHSTWYSRECLDIPLLFTFKAYVASLHVMVKKRIISIPNWE